MRFSRSSAVFLTTLSLGCSGDLPFEELIVEHRILGAPVRVVESVDPDEDLLEPGRAQAMPTETIEVTPLVVSPGGVVDPQDVDLMWVACELFPGRGPFACLQDAMPLSADGLPTCEFAALEALAGGPIPPMASPCLVGREAVPRFAIPVSEGITQGADLELTVIGSTPGGTTTDDCARELLAGEHDVPDDCLYGVQVAEVGPKEALLLLADELGIDVGVPLPAPAEVPEPDRHIRITSFRVTVLDDREREVVAPREVEFGEMIEAEHGQVLRIDTVSPQEDLQSISIPINNGEAFEEKSEAFYGNWYVSFGELFSLRSADPHSYNLWELRRGEQGPQEPVDEIAHLYYVVRDSRKGLAWWSFSVRVR